MPTYHFSLRLADSQQNYRYSLDLSSYQEDYPEFIFTPDQKEKIRIYFESQSSCRIEDYHLQKIITVWAEDISEGYRESSLVLNLQSIHEANLLQLKDSGAQLIPEIINPTFPDIDPTRGALPKLEFDEF
jgi:hypothetical protein